MVNVRESGQAGVPIGNLSKEAEQSGTEALTITPEMVVAGVERMRKSVCESQQSSADVWVVLEILEDALAVRSVGARNFLTTESKRKILADTRQRLLRK